MFFNSHEKGEVDGQGPDTILDEPRVGCGEQASSGTLGVGGGVNGFVPSRLLLTAHERDQQVQIKDRESEILRQYDLFSREGKVANHQSARSLNQHSCSADKTNPLFISSSCRKSRSTIHFNVFFSKT